MIPLLHPDLILLADALSPAERSHAVALLFIYLGVALVVSFLCSVAEAVLLSVNDAYIHDLRSRRPRSAAFLAEFRANPDKALTAILTLNTVAHTVGAAGVGHEAAVIFGEKWLGLSSAIMTVLILVGSEIIPKTLGATRWRQLAPGTARGVRWLTVVLAPVIAVMRSLTERLRTQAAVEAPREEIAALAMLASSSKHLREAEAAILRNVFQLRDTKVETMMTPHSEVFALPETMKVGEYRSAYPKSPFSRVPLLRDGSEVPAGFVLRVELLAASEAGAPLSYHRRELDTVAADTSVADLYSKLIRSRSHIAAVIDAERGFAGIVTLEDAIETVLGTEIEDEMDRGGGESPRRPGWKPFRRGPRK